MTLPNVGGRYLTVADTTQDPAPEGWRLDSLNCLMPVKLCVVLSRVSEKYLVSEVQLSIGTWKNTCS